MAIFYQRNVWLVGIRLYLLGVLCVYLVSCNDPPGPVGSGTLPNENINLVTVNSDTVSLITNTLVGQITPKLTQDIATPGGSSPAFIGAAVLNDMRSEKVTATTFLSFNPQSLSDSARQALYGDLRPSDIISAVLLLNPSRYVLGDSIGQLSPFRIHSLSRPWYTDNLRNTIFLEDPALIGPQVGIYQNTIGNTGRIDASQNLSNKLPIPITDKQLMIRWLQANEVTWQNVDGLAIIPNASLARTMYAHTGLARVVVTIKRPTDSVESTVIFNQFAHASIVRTALPNNPENLMVVQGGAALRTQLSFDLSSLPSFAAIHRAELILPIDTIRSTISNQGYPSAMQLYFTQTASFPSASRPFESRRNVINPPSAVGFFDNTTGTARYIFSGQLTTAVPNLNTVIEYIVKEGGKKQMILQLRPETIINSNGQTIISRSDEEQTTSRIVFYGLQEQNPINRPRLVITYSRRYTVPR